MASYLVFDVVDIHGMTSPWRMRITDVAPDSDVVTMATALAAAAFGATKPSQGGYSNVRLEIDGLLSPLAPQADSDVRQNWQLGIVDVSEAVFRLGLPARNDAIALYATGSKVLANLSAATWVALDTALIGVTVPILNTKTGDDAGSIIRGIASVRSRKRPREGGSR